MPNVATERAAQVRIGRTIRAFMAARGEKQTDLAHLLSIDPGQVSRMLTGTRKMTVDELAIVAAHYGRHPGVFFDEFEDLVPQHGGADQNRKKMNGPDLQIIAGEGTSRASRGGATLHVVR